MKRLRAGFQGELGAFSQQAIRQLLGDAAQPVPYPRFDQVFAALAAGETDTAVIPIENTLAGSVHENYDHLRNHEFRIVGETHVRIVHHLLAAPGVRFRDLKRAYSHPVALGQCLRFFAAHPQIERTPFYDTAGAARMVVAENRRDAAAIASELAARIYGARILKRSLEDDRENYTRFFLLEHPQRKLRLPPRRGPAKTSLVFTVRNVPGSLFRAMAAFALRDISLAKIESRPLRGKPWEYLFYVDIAGDETDPPVARALSHLAELTTFLKVLGSYPQWNRAAKAPAR